MQNAFAQGIIIWRCVCWLGLAQYLIRTAVRAGRVREFDGEWAGAGRRTMLDEKAMLLMMTLQVQQAIGPGIEVGGAAQTVACAEGEVLSGVVDL